MNLTILKNLLVFVKSAHFKAKKKNQKKQKKDSQTAYTLMLHYPTPCMHLYTFGLSPFPLPATCFMDDPLWSCVFVFLKLSNKKAASKLAVI